MTDEPKPGNPGGANRPEGEDGPGGTSLAAIVFVILLVAGGVWLAMEMYDNARYQECVAARRRNCDNIEYRAIPRPPETK